MVLLSHSAQIEVDHAKDGIEELSERIDSLNGFVNGLALYFYTNDVETLSRTIASHEASITKTIAKYFGEDSEEAKLLDKRIHFGTVPSGLDKEGLKRALRRNVAKAQDALEDAKRQLEEKITKIKNEPTPILPERDKRKDGDGKQDPLFVLKPTLWGMGIDLRELWRRLRGR